jgi:opacity protein-like surface antigen
MKLLSKNRYYCPACGAPGCFGDCVEVRSGGRPIAAIAASLAILAAPVAQADEPSHWTLYLGGLTHHLRNDSIHNDINEGLGLEYRVSDSLGFAMGAYRNSLYKTSVYGLVRYQPLTLGSVRVGAVAGLIDGYSYHHGAYFPAAMPALSLDVGRTTLTLVGIPNIGRAIDGMVSLQVGVRF